MDWNAGKQQVLGCIKKNRYVVLFLVIGIFLMLLPDAAEKQPETVQIPETQVQDVQDVLAEILSNISGVGKTQVLLTEKQGSSTIYQTDVDTSQTSTRQNTVIVTNGNREDIGLIRQSNPPVYLGALIVCQGADSASVRLAVVEAVKSVTGLSSDCITVLKMK